MLLSPFPTERLGQLARVGPVLRAAQHPVLAGLNGHSFSDRRVKVINQDALAKYMKMAGGDDAAGETETEGDEQGAENDEQAEE